jgi:hypothetical protein
MRKYGLSVFFLAVLAIAITLACGSSPRVLQSVNLSPLTADAQDSPPILNDADCPVPRLPSKTIGIFVAYVNQTCSENSVSRE